MRCVFAVDAREVCLLLSLNGTFRTNGVCVQVGNNLEIRSLALDRMIEEEKLLRKLSSTTVGFSLFFSFLGVALLVL